MKEEANVTSSSAMYGVELLHEAGAHHFLRDMGLAEKLYVRSRSGGDGAYEQPPSGLSRTLGINWVTPRSTDSRTSIYFLYAVVFLGIDYVGLCKAESKTNPSLALRLWHVGTASGFPK